MLSYHRNFKIIIQEKCAKYNTHWEEAVLAIATFEESWVVSFRTFKWLGGFICVWVGVFWGCGIMMLVGTISAAPMACSFQCPLRGGLRCAWVHYGLFMVIRFFFFSCVGTKAPPAAKMPWGWSSVSFFQCEKL